MKKLLIQLFLFYMIGQCNSVFCQHIPVLDLTLAFENPSNVALSDYIETISYMPLATSGECLVDNFPKVFVTKEYIITVTNKRCLLFNRKDGSFVREIGRNGRGPGEYQITNGFFNEHIPAYYFTGWNGYLIKYTMDGEFRGNIMIPGYKDSFEDSSFPMNFSFLNDSLIVCDFLISNGTESKSFMIFNEKGKVLRLIPNSNILKNKQKAVFQTNEMSYHHFNDNLFFQSMYNDTVFQISTDKITPSFILNRGVYSPPFESKWWPNYQKLQSRFIVYPQYFENKRLIALNFYLNRIKYFALYDKKSKFLKVVENQSGIKNDIDGFMDITFTSINDSGELSCIIQPSDLIKWIQINPDKFKKLKPELRKLNDVGFSDNPIIVIAKLKH